MPEKSVQLTSDPKWLIAGQFAILLGITLFFTLFDWDRQISALFFQIDKKWYLRHDPFWAWFHEYGTIPGIVLTLTALITWLTGFYVKRLRAWRRPCLIVVLTTIIGAGLLVNAVFKDYWGRPRPSQITEFGGRWEYRHIFPPGTPGKGASFPCGHCTMGFVFLAMIAFHRHSKALAYGGVAVGVVLGGLLSAARVLQGAHFTSDTIWSLGIITMVITALIFYLPRPRTRAPDVSKPPVFALRRALITAGTIVAVLIIAGGFMTRRPYYETWEHQLNIFSSIEVVHIHINDDPESLSIQFKNQKKGKIRVDTHGFGWMSVDHQVKFSTEKKNNTLNVNFDMETRSYFSELYHALTLTLPEHVRDRVLVLVNDKPEPQDLIKNTSINGN